MNTSEAIKDLLAAVGPGDETPMKREVLARVGRRPVAQLVRTKGGGMQLLVEKVHLPKEEADQLIGQIVDKVRCYLFAEHDDVAKSSAR